MTIQIICPNGHKLKAKDSYAGRSLPCPKCGETIVVPKSEAALAQEMPADADRTSTAAPTLPQASAQQLAKSVFAAIFFARVDGAVKVYRQDIPPEWFLGFVTPSGGELPPRDLKQYELH